MNKKCVVVTGCSSGIGYDAAITLQAKGYDVIASCRQQQDVERLITQGLNCHLLDLASDKSIDAFVSILKQQGKPVFGLVNNGAFGVPGAVEDLNRQALLTQFQTNVFGTHQLTAAIIPMMREQNSGRIIQISSILGALCLRFRGAYNASKYALEALSDTLRLELADTNIKISLVQPGPIETHFRGNALKMYQRFIDKENSHYKMQYEAVESRLESDQAVRFTLAPSEVTQHIIHALESKRPKTRYRVTIPSRILLPLKRLMPDKWMDALLLKIG